MLYTRREIGKLALTTVPAASLVENPLAALAQSGKPNSVIGGVSIGTITYSYQYAGPERRGDASVRRRIGHQSDRADERPAESFAGTPQGARDRMPSRKSRNVSITARLHSPPPSLTPTRG
jgi:hypothetical protein